MLEQTLGRLRKESEERRGIRFERIYDYTVEELWRAWTNPSQLRTWLGDVEIAHLLPPSRALGARH